MRQDPVVHFEMGASDKKRMVNFYQSTFGWETNQLGEEYGGYIMAMTAESDESGPKKPGSINGGFYQWQEGKKEPPHIVVDVENLKERMEMVKTNGGKVLGEPMNIPNVGEFVMIEDTEGNRVGMMQSAEKN